MGLYFNQNLSTTLSSVDTLIKPILLYCGDFWGCLKLPKNNHIENLHMMICKSLLGVKKQTTNVGVLLELGRIPLHIYASKFAIKNWERIRMGIGNEILLESCQNSVENQGWLHRIKQTLESNEMSNVYDEIPNSVYPFVHKNFFEKLKENFHKTAFDQIKSESSKLRTYSLFKTEVGIEKYMSDMKKCRKSYLGYEI